MLFFCMCLGTGPGALGTGAGGGARAVSGELPAPGSAGKPALVCNEAGAEVEPQGQNRAAN